VDGGTEARGLMRCGGGGVAVVPLAGIYVGATGVTPPWALAGRRCRYRLPALFGSLGREEKGRPQVVSGPS
jgi:hypothetical protein